MKKYIKRSIEKFLLETSKQFPAIILTGPRQSGKTTLLKHLFEKSHEYVSLESPDNRNTAINDPKKFLEIYKSPVIFDEIQYTPDLLCYIKEKIDENRNKYGQFILTGSQNLLLLDKVTETLAGRAAILKLLPLSTIEVINKPQSKFIWEKNNPKIKDNEFSLIKFWEQMLRGSYPELIAHPKKNHLTFHNSYIQTYLERDVRSIKHISDLTQFQMFLTAVAARSGQLFQASEVARDIGVSTNTIKAWISILEATHQIIILRPYYANVTKRLVKTPKIYFTDAGILCYLMRMKDTTFLESGPMTGAVFETFVINEIFKRFCNRGSNPRMYFWRTAKGEEVDLIIEEHYNKIIPIEIKSSSTAHIKMGDNIASLKKDLGEKVAEGYVVYTGNITLPLNRNVKAIPVSLL